MLLFIFSILDQRSFHSSCLLRSMDSKFDKGVSVSAILLSEKVLTFFIQSAEQTDLHSRRINFNSVKNYCFRGKWNSRYKCIMVGESDSYLPYVLSFISKVVVGNSTISSGKTKWNSWPCRNCISIPFWAAFWFRRTFKGCCKASCNYIKQVISYSTGWS